MTESYVRIVDVADFVEDDDDGAQEHELSDD